MIGSRLRFSCEPISVFIKRHILSLKKVYVGIKKYFFEIGRELKYVCVTLDNEVENKLEC